MNNFNLPYNCKLCGNVIKNRYKKQGYCQCMNDRYFDKETSVYQTVWPSKIRRDYRKLISDMKPETINSAKVTFFRSKQWLQLRYDTFKNCGRKCCLCGATDTELHIDHIVPISKNWDLRADKDNLQVLCRECNIGKGNRDSTDFR